SFIDGRMGRLQYHVRLQVSNQLVAHHVVLKPALSAAPLSATQHAAVEGACGVEVMDGNGDMEGLQGGHGSSAMKCRRHCSAALADTSRAGHLHIPEAFTRAPCKFLTAGSRLR